MTTENETDEELMRLTALGDANAFRKLLLRYEKKVFSFAWRLCSDQRQAEDLTQEAFLKIWRNAGSWRPEAKLETWIYRVLYNLFIDSRRRTKEPAEELSEDIRSNEDTPEEALLKKREVQEITEALDCLPERQKEALVLCYYQEMKAKDAADVLSVSQSALEALLFRARQTLKEKLCKRRKKND